MPDGSFAYACGDRRRVPLSAARVMRHFSFLPLPVALLTTSVQTPPASRLLVATAGRKQGLAPRRLTAPRRAVAMPTVAPRADVDHSPALIAHETAAVRTALQDQNLDKGLDANPFAARYSAPGAFHPRPPGGRPLPHGQAAAGFHILPPPHTAQGALTRATMMMTP